MREDMTELCADVAWYARHGFRAQCEKAARYAQCMTRAYIERLHPATGFGGKSLRKATTSNGRSDNLIKKGSFKAVGTGVYANIYSDYYARFYNTGVYFKPGRGRNKNKNLANMRQEARGHVYTQNASAIQKYFALQVQEYLKRHIDIRFNGR